MPSIAPGLFVTREMVPCVQLNGRLGCPDFHHPPRLGILGLCRAAKVAAFASHDEAVVVALGRLVLTDPIADRRWRSKVQAAPRNAVVAPRRDQISIDIQHMVSVYRKNRVEDVSAPHAAQIPVAVIAEVDVCWGVGRRLEDHFDLIGIRKGVFCNRLEGTGEPFLPIRAVQPETDRGRSIIIDRFGLPQQMVETDRTTMEVVLTQVRRYLIGLVIDPKPAIPDPVTKPADRRAEMGVLGKVGLQPVEC